MSNEESVALNARIEEAVGPLREEIEQLKKRVGRLEMLCWRRSIYPITEQEVQP